MLLVELEPLSNVHDPDCLNRDVISDLLHHRDRGFTIRVEMRDHGKTLRTNPICALVDLLLDCCLCEQPDVRHKETPFYLLAPQSTPEIDDTTRRTVPVLMTFSAQHLEGSSFQPGFAFGSHSEGTTHRPRNRKISLSSILPP